MRPTTRPLTLPPADKFGNYWFGRPTDTGAPAVLPIRSPCNLNRGMYMVSLGAGGMVWDGAYLAAYEDPGQALAALNRELRAGG